MQCFMIGILHSRVVLFQVEVKVINSINELPEMEAEEASVLLPPSKKSGKCNTGFKV